MNTVRMIVAVALVAIVCAGGVAAQGVPEIDIQRPLANSIPDGGSDYLGSLTAGVGTNFTYTVLNTGTGDLAVGGGRAPSTSIGSKGGVGIQNPVNCSVITIVGPVSPVVPSSSTTFVIKVTPTAAGAFSFDIELVNDDPDEDPYDIAVSGTAVAVPEIDLQRPVANSIPSGASDTVYGAVMAQPLLVTWTIENFGLLGLNLTGSPLVAVSNLLNCSAAVTRMPPVQVGPRSTTDFELTVTPTNAGAFGFDLSIASDDSDENPYLLIVSGDAQAFAAPEIELRNPVGGAIPSGGADIAYGVVAGAPSFIDYEIHNLGSLDLNLTGSPLVAFSNQVNCTVNSLQPATPIALQTFESFLTSIVASASGAFSFDVSIDNDDPDEDPYTFAVSGVAQATAAPEIDIQRPLGVSITDGGNDTLTGVAAAIAATFTYTVQNQGAQSLILTLPIVFSGQSNCTVSVTQQPSGTVAPSGAVTTFEIEVTAAVAGAFSFNLSLGNNDANEDPYDIAVSGTASAAPDPEIDIQRPVGNSIANGGIDVLTGVVYQRITTVSYRILNQGSGDLVLTASPSFLNVQAMSNCTVIVVQQPSGTIAPSSSSVGAIEVFAPTIGPFSFELVVVSNDADEATYLITVQGVAAGAAGGVPGGSSGGGCVTLASGSTAPLWGLVLAMLLGIGIASRRLRRE